MTSTAILDEYAELIAAIHLTAAEHGIVADGGSPAGILARISGKLTSAKEDAASSKEKLGWIHDETQTATAGDSARAEESLQAIARWSNPDDDGFSAAPADATPGSGWRTGAILRVVLAAGGRGFLPYVVHETAKELNISTTLVDQIANHAASSGLLTIDQGNGAVVITDAGKDYLG